MEQLASIVSEGSDLNSIVLRNTALSDEKVEVLMKSLERSESTVKVENVFFFVALPERGRENSRRVYC